MCVCACVCACMPADAQLALWAGAFTPGRTNSTSSTLSWPSHLGLDLWLSFAVETVNPHTRTLQRLKNLSGRLGNADDERDLYLFVLDARKWTVYASNRDVLKFRLCAAWKGGIRTTTTSQIKRPSLKTISSSVHPVAWLGQSRPAERRLVAVLLAWLR
ncbi:unnamed protein product [Protopolystoma xenopodis]|uniref:Uncharacterized protein n=1 Tax=Protopolystoma xenopodis TaxID=117903 RepID=A0A3S5ARM1_9PLAT|nr:unnamed protein product [Protopolystoma xenopodis]